MRIHSAILLSGVTFMTSSCGGHSLNDYTDTAPKADVKSFFNGPVRGWGLVQDWRGRAVKRFDVEMNGQWQGDTGTLTEKFRFYDGKVQERVWTLKKLGEGVYEGSAGDILGPATGAATGSAVRWSYQMDLPVDDTTYRVRFDDWMWAMNGDALFNRSYIKKFGFTVAELTIFMQKQKP